MHLRISCAGFDTVLLWNMSYILLCSLHRSPFVNKSLSTVQQNAKYNRLLIQYTVTYDTQLAFRHATRSVIVGNQMVIDKNFPIKGNAFFIIFKNSPKFEYRGFVSAIYAKREFDSSSSTSIWGKYLCKVSLIRENVLIESPFLINFNVKSHKI